MSLLGSPNSPSSRASLFGSVMPHSPSFRRQMSFRSSSPSANAAPPPVLPRHRPLSGSPPASGAPGAPRARDRAFCLGLAVVFIVSVLLWGALFWVDGPTSLGGGGPLMPRKHTRLKPPRWRVPDETWRIYRTRPPPCEHTIPYRHVTIYGHGDWSTNRTALDEAVAIEDLTVDTVSCGPADSAVHLQAAGLPPDTFSCSISYKVPHGGDPYPPVQELLDAFPRARMIDYVRNQIARPFAYADPRIDSFQQEFFVHPADYYECTRG